MTETNYEFRFEIEHVFAEALYSLSERRDFLENLGFFQQMRSNQVGLFSNQDTVNALQNADEKLKADIIAAGGRHHRH